MTDFPALFRALARGHVDYILVGGVAATAHGASRLTSDLDIVYRRSQENVERLVAALAPYDPYPRGAPRGLRFLWDAETVLAGLNFTLATTLGDLDLLGEIVGGGRYEDLAADTVTLELFGTSCLCLSLPRLISVKRAAGRPKDFDALAELEQLREEYERGDR